MSLEGIRDFSVIATAPPEAAGKIKTLRAARGRQHHARSTAARAQAQRPGVFPAQRGQGSSHNRRARLEELVPGPSRYTARCPNASWNRSLEGTSTSANATTCCAPPSSKPASTSPPPTPSSSTAPTASAWRSCAAARRVGRSHHQAYAYLLTPGEMPKSRTTPEAPGVHQAMEETRFGLLPRHARPGSPRHRRILGIRNRATSRVGSVYDGCSTKRCGR